MRSYKLDGPGPCIFCLEVYPPDKMTAEHIIPLSLSGEGEMIIKNGSCADCNRRANEKYEQTVLKTNLRIPRLLLQLRRRKRKAPADLPLVGFGKIDDIPRVEFVHQLKREDYPPIFILIALRVAGRLVNDDLGSGLSQPSIVYIRWGAGRMAAPSVALHSDFCHTEYALFLAKIAYCFAVAELGLDGFDGADIRDILCGRRNDVYNFVGGHSVQEHLANTHLHALYLRQRGEWTTVLVHLFASFGGVVYEVVVGTRR